MSLGWLVAGTLHGAAPTGIVLSALVVKENSTPGTVVGDLTAVDEDSGDTHTFAMAEGTGSQDNYGFAVSGNQLVVPFGVAREGIYVDFEAEQLVFAIRLKVTDAANQSYERAFTIQMTDDGDEDADGDGLSEMTEETVHGSSDVVFDTDGDGFGDGAEVFGDSSPTDVNDWPDYPLIAWGDNRVHEFLTPADARFLALSTGQRHTLGVRGDGTVEAWGGYNLFGQNTVPAGLSGVVAVAAGGDFWLEDSAHSLALKSDGTVVEWGYDDEERIAPPTGLGEVVGIAAGRIHRLALKRDGTVVAWGHSYHGEAAAPTGLTDVVAIAAGGFYSLALKSDGTVAGWGDNFNGEQWEPAAVPAGLCDVVAISAGRFHSLALKSNGTVVAWGNNVNGQATVPPGLDRVIAIAAGGFHSLALKEDGSVVAWGLNTRGQATVPVGASSGVKFISAGIQHSLALRESAAVPTITSSPRIDAAPGALIAHQLTTSAVESNFSAIGLPVELTLNQQTGLISGTVTNPIRRTIRITVDTDQGQLTGIVWLNVAGGFPPTAITLTERQVTENSPSGTPVGVLGAVDPDGVTGITFELVGGEGSADNSRFLISGNQLLLDGQLARDFEQNPAGFTIRVRARDPALNFYEEVLSLQFLDDRQEDADRDGLTEAEEEGTSDLTYDSDGDGFGDGFETDRGTSPANGTDFPAGQILVSWGSAEKGQTTVPAGLGEVVGLAAGRAHNLALRADGTVAAWGWNEAGQCTVPAELADVVAVAAGVSHSIALKEDGTVAAWGGNGDGQVTVPVNLSGVVAVAAGDFHSLALTGDGTVVAWGNNDHGQATVPAGLSKVVAIAAGAFHSLALKSDGRVVSWGADGSATAASLERVVAITAGGLHSLALKSDGSVVGWGEIEAGQATAQSGVLDIAAGWRHGMALQQNGTVKAWGDAAYGQTEVPLEARSVRLLAAGGFHNVALRQASGFPRIAPAGPVKGWRGQTVGHQIVVEGVTTAAGFTAMGLPDDLTLNPETGLITGTVVTGQRRAVRISVDTDKGRLSRMLWFDTASGKPPTSIQLAPVVPQVGPISLLENSPPGTLVGTLSVSDPDEGDNHTFSVAVIQGSANPYCLQVVGDQLTVNSSVGIDFEASGGNLVALVLAVDSEFNIFEEYFVITLLDDRLEDADGDGVNEAKEEDVFFTSDVEFDDFTKADEDGDGVPVLIEHAFNLNLQAPDAGHLLGGAGSTSGLPIIYPVIDGEGERRLRMEYLRRVGSGLEYVPEFSSGLGQADWTPALQEPEVIPVTPEWERCVIDDNQFTPSPPRRFGRVGVSQ